MKPAQGPVAGAPEGPGRRAQAEAAWRRVGGGDRGGRGKGEVAQGPPQASAAARAPKARTSTRRRSGPSSSIARWQVGRIEFRSRKEDIDGVADRPDRGPRPPVDVADRFDLGRDRGRLKVVLAGALDAVGEGPQADLVPPMPQLFENRHRRHQVAKGGGGVDEDAAHCPRRISGSSSSRIASCVCRRLRPRSPAQQLPDVCR